MKTSIFYNHLNKYCEVDQKTFDKILAYFDVVEVPKKEILSAAADKINRLYFVLEGCIHQFYTTDKGIDRTLQFALEKWWLADHLAHYRNRPTPFYIQAVEKSTLLVIPFERYECLLKEKPVLERYFRHIFQISSGAALYKIWYRDQQSKEEMYLNFVNEFPEFAQRVPQYLIASFLGLTPEYVSEIRAKMRS